MIMCWPVVYTLPMCLETEMKWSWGMEGTRRKAFWVSFENSDRAGRPGLTSECFKTGTKSQRGKQPPAKVWQRMALMCEFQLTLTSGADWECWGMREEGLKWWWGEGCASSWGGTHHTWALLWANPTVLLEQRRCCPSLLETPLCCFSPCLRFRVWTSDSVWLCRSIRPSGVVWPKEWVL